VWEEWEGGSDGVQKGCCGAFGQVCFLPFTFTALRDSS
jgi:hypothetical protein